MDYHTEKRMDERDQVHIAERSRELAPPVYGVGCTITLENGRSIIVRGARTPQEAVRQAVLIARRAGWKPRRWWELWKPTPSRRVLDEYRRQVRPETTTTFEGPW